TAPLTNRPRRRILRGRKIISVEQVMEQLRAEACNGAELDSSSESIEDTNEIGRYEVERQELLRQRMGIREQQRLKREDLPDFNMTRDRAPSISLTVSASVLDETSSLTITAASIAEVYNDDKDENVDPLLGYIESTETVHKGIASRPLQIASQVRQDSDPLGIKETKRQSEVDAGMKGVAEELHTLATNNKIVQETTNEVQTMLDEEEEPMQIDNTLDEADSLHKKTAMAVEQLQIKDGSAGSRSGHLMRPEEETIGAPVKESDAYQHVQTERVCANKKEQMVHSDDFVGEAETDFGLSRRWVSRKSYAYGQGFGIINREHLTAARRYSTGPFKLAGSDVKDSANEVVKAVEETELQNVHYTGDSDATFTVTDAKARNIAQPIVSDEELAARTLIRLSETASKEERIVSISTADASSTRGEEVTIISRTMELEESSASKEAPKNRWDDATITENRGRSELGSSTFDGGSSVAPASIKESFEESSIAKSSATVVRNESSLSTMNTPRSMRDELLGILDVTYGGHPTAPKTNKTILSFKTPKKTVAVPSTKGDSKNASSNKSSSKQTESTKNDRVSSGRATSTPNEVEAHVCPRFAAHQAASTTPKSASDRNKTSSPSSTSQMIRIGPGTRILHSPVVNLAHEDPSSPFRVPSLPIARVQRPSLALSQIADYKSPLYTPKRSAGNTAYTSRSSSSRASLISPRPASSSSRIPAPTNDLGKVSNESGIVAKVQSYLRSGGTPRPNTSAENTRSVPFASQDSVVKSGPRTPAVHFDVSRMLAGNVTASGPVYRRQPLNSGERSRLALPSHAKLNFDDGADSDEEYNTKQASKSVVTEPTSTDEVDIHEEDDRIPKGKVMIDSDDNGDCGVGALESDTSRLSIHDSIDDPKVDVSDKTGGAAKRTGRSTIARLMDQSVATLDSPKIEEEWSAMSRLQEAVRQRVSLTSSCSSAHSEGPLHVVAARNRQELVAGYLPKRKIVRPNNEQGDGLRRSVRNRVAPNRHWLGEVPIYRVDAQGNRELVDVSTPRIRDPFLLKYNAPSMEVALERSKQTQRLHKHSRYLLRSRKISRKQEKIKELKEKHKHCEDLDMSVTDVKTSDEDDDQPT
uniref:Uncharacterized protein n=1 Tax=Parascaris univalens TaxID=6257 RepID=A0A914ZWX5_PARUN